MPFHHDLLPKTVLLLSYECVADEEERGTILYLHNYIGSQHIKNDQLLHAFKQFFTMQYLFFV